MGHKGLGFRHHFGALKPHPGRKDNLPVHSSPQKRPLIPTKKPFGGVFKDKITPHEPRLLPTSHRNLNDGMLVTGDLHNQSQTTHSNKKHNHKNKAINTFFKQTAHTTKHALSSGTKQMNKTKDQLFQFGTNTLDKLTSPTTLLFLGAGAILIVLIAK